SGDGPHLDFSGTQTVSGTGRVVLDNSYRSGLLLSGNNTTLTIGAGVTMSGGRTDQSTSYGAVIGYSDWWGGGSNAQVINQGTIAADTSGRSLYVNPTGGFTNQGKLQVSSGAALFVNGAWTNAATASVTATSGTLGLGSGSSAWSNAGSISVTNNTTYL